MDTKIFKRTQDTLGKIIVRPPLTDKLLAKPPFRFLHDIITSVIKSTGFMQGLYTSEEQNSDNVKDKESKMKFLQKAIDIVSLVTEKQLSVRPSKVVAGHEPEKTNEFLQVLAEAVKRQVDNDAYVQRVLKGADGSKRQESNKEKEKSKEKSKERRQPENEEQHKPKEKGSKENNSRSDRHKSQSENEIKTDGEKRNKTEGKENRKSKSEQKSRSKGEEKDSQQNKIEEKERQRNNERERHQAKDEEKPKEKQSSDKEKSSRKSLKDDTKENEKPSQETNEKTPDDITLRKLTRPTSAKGSRHKKEENEVSPVPSDMQLSSAVETTDGQQTKVSPKAPEHSSSLNRVGSARRAPPKLRTSEVIDDPMIQLGNGKPTNVITDDGAATDEEEQFILEDATLLPNKNVPSKTDETGTIEDGGLVNKLLETKKELEGTIASEEKSKVKIENSIMTNTAYQRQRELTESKILKLQGSIQGLTKSANPLGKIMDYIQEDLDSMHKELNQWKGEKLEYRLALKEEREITEKALQPLKLQLATLDEAIKEQLDIIATIKANVIHNDSRIETMLHSVAKL
ncbi:TRAF3-interacting protein 1 isoform X1 [Octopus bimaculoides]|nr:TRAF3-interacting protein 1 isoform X1 [Octopus bimaculoides]